MISSYDNFSSIVPCCVIRGNEIVKTNDKFDALKLVNFLPNLLDLNAGKSALETPDKSYLVYCISEEGTSEKLYTFFDSVLYSSSQQDLAWLVSSYNEIPLTGNAGIDRQHDEIAKCLFEATKLYEEGTTTVIIVEKLLRIKALAIAHFKYEEGLISSLFINKRKQDYLHIEDHNNLLRQLSVLLSEITIDNLGKSLKWLRGWLVVHIYEYDTQLAIDIKNVESHAQRKSS